MNVEKLQKNQMKATFHIEKAEFDQAIDKAFPIANQKVTIKGFRQGKAPKNVYMKHYGRESLYNEAINIVAIDKIENELYQDSSLQIISEPQIDLDFAKLEDEAGWDLFVYFEVMPEVTLGQYKGIEVKKPSNRVLKAELDEYKNNLLASKIKSESADKALAEGDTAILDYTGYIGDEKFAGGEAKEQSLKIGSHYFIPGFEEQMVGMKKGEEKDLFVTFPENYQAEELKGKEARFHVLLHDVKVDVMPELNEELFKELKLECKTVEDFDKYVKEQVKLQKEKNNENEIKNEVLNKLVESSTVDVPESIVNRNIDAERKRMEDMAKAYGVSYEDLLRWQGLDPVKYEEDLKAYFERNVKFELVIDKIIEVEKLDVTDEEVEHVLKTYPESKEVSRDRQKYQARLQALTNKAVNLVVDSKVLI